MREHSDRQSQWNDSHLVNEVWLASQGVQQFLGTARRYRWLLATVCALIWSAGLTAAYDEYATTYESHATIWVLQASAEMAASIADQPDIPLVNTAASQQTELLTQLLQTRSFVRDVVERTSLRSDLATAPDERKFLDTTRKHFRVQTLGTNLMSVAFTAHDPTTPFEMVSAALAVREERVAKARVDSSSILSTLYQREFDVAQAQARDAQQKFDAWVAGHEEPVSDIDEHERAQLRLTLDLAQVRLNDLKGRMDRAVLAPTLLEVSGLEFQIVDQPRQESVPSGGERSAVMLAAVALASGLMLAAFLAIAGTLLADRVGAPADVRRLAPAKVFAAVPRIAGTKRHDEGDLRMRLAAIAFGEGQLGQKDIGS